jgi:predicted secreted hydrolase
MKSTRARSRVALSASLLVVTAAVSCSPVPAVPAGPKVRLAPAPEVLFARATAPRAFRLPKDHGPHFEFQTEWWYYTGNVSSADGRRFGFQLTFFRRGLSPGPPPSSGLATNQIYFAHFALTDVAARSHRSAERFSRGAAGLAGADARPFRVWLEDWKVESRNADGSSLHVRARDGGMLLDLELEARKPLVAHGDRGVSPKSDEPGNASYYVGYTRLAARGRIASNGEPVAAAGEAWFDHEWSTSALGPQAVGWDWWSLQLDDDRELMFFVIRRADGSAETASGGTLVARDGTTRRLRRDDVAVKVLERWTSPESRAEYPARWWLQVPSEGLALEISPRVSDQEMRTSFTYWEGAVQVEGVSRGRRVAGQGYVELTGYVRSMQGVF